MVECAGLTKSGTRCTRWVNGTTFCAWHDPDAPERRDEMLVVLRNASSRAGKISAAFKRRRRRQKSQRERDLNSAKLVLQACEKLSRELGVEDDKVLAEMLDAIDAAMRNASSRQEQLALVPQRDAFTKARRILRSLPKMDTPGTPDTTRE